MKTRTIVAALFLLTASFAAASAQDAAATYAAKCKMCHGADGKGGPAGKSMGVRDLTTPPASTESDAEWITITTKGKNKMPAYDGKLSADQITGVVKYIRTLK